MKKYVIAIAALITLSGLVMGFQEGELEQNDHLETSADESYFSFADSSMSAFMSENTEMESFTQYDSFEHDKLMSLEKADTKQEDRKDAEKEEREEEKKEVEKKEEKEEKPEKEVEKKEKEKQEEKVKEIEKPEKPEKPEKKDVEVVKPEEPKEVKEVEKPEKPEKDKKEVEKPEKEEKDVEKPEQPEKEKKEDKVEEEKKEEERVEEEKKKDDENHKEDEKVERKDEEKEYPEEEVEKVSGELRFKDQDLSKEGDVTVEDVTTKQDSFVLITYDYEDRLVVAGLEAVGEVENEDVYVEVEDTDGFPGDHTAHVISTEDVSSEYEIGDYVSEETGSEILDQDTAEIS